MTNQDADKGPFGLRDSHIAAIIICVGVFFSFGGISVFAYFGIIKGFGLWAIGLVSGLTLVAIGIVLAFRALK